MRNGTGHNDKLNKFQESDEDSLTLEERRERNLAAGSEFVRRLNEELGPVPKLPK